MPGSPVDWLIIVKSPSGWNSITGNFSSESTGTLTYVTREDGQEATISAGASEEIFELQWETTPGGLTRSITIVTDSINFDPYDTVQVFTKGVTGWLTPDPPTSGGLAEDTSKYYPRAFGVVAQSSSGHGDNVITRVECVGAEAYLAYSPTNNFERAAGKDIARFVADDALTGLTLPFGIQYRQFRRLLVTSTGAISSGGRDIKSFMDTLVGLAASGGVTAYWGVNPYGYLVFDEVDSTNIDFTFGQAAARVDYSPAQSPPGEVITKVKWYLGEEPPGQWVHAAAGFFSTDGDTTYDATGNPVTHTSDSGITGDGTHFAFLRPPREPGVEVPGLVALAGTYSLQTGSSVASFVGTTQDGSFDITRVGDNDPISYIVVDGTAVLGGGVKLRFVPTTAINAEKIRAVSVRLQINKDSNDLEDDSRFLFYFNFKTSFTTSGKDFFKGPTIPRIKETFFSGDGAVSSGHSGQGVDHVELVLENDVLGASQGAVRYEIEDFRVYTVDDTALDGLAEEQYRAVTASPSAIHFDEQVPPNASTVNDTLTIDAILTKLSNEGGVECVIKIGEIVPDFDALRDSIPEDYEGRARRDSLTIQRLVSRVNLRG